MACIVYRTIKGNKYAYSSESYWDPVKKAPRTRRKYLGKVDPDTGSIIRVYNKSAKSEVADARLDEALEPTKDEALLEELERLKEENLELQEQVASLTAKFTALKDLLESFP